MSDEARKWILRIGALSVVSFFLFAAAGALKPIPQSDTPSYLDFQWDWSPKGLSGVRTPGYPAFAQIIASTVGVDWLPSAHAIVYLLAIVFLFLSLIQVGFRASSATAVCAPLLLGRSISQLGPWLLADSLAVSLSLLSLGFFLRLWKHARSWCDWIGLSLCVFAAVITRPACLYLVALWPVLSLWFSWWGEGQFSYSKLRRHFLGCSAACTAPLIAYSLVRWIAIGHFGLVSFTGYNTIGISAQAILEPGMLDSLPAHLRSVGHGIADESIRQGIELDTGSFHGLEENYDRMLWTLSIPVVKAECGDDPAAINRTLLQLTWHIFRERPDIYVRWILGNSSHAILQHAIVNLQDLGMSCVVVAWGVLTLIFLYRYRTNRTTDVRISKNNPSAVTPKNALFPVTTGFHEFQVLFWIVAFYVASSSLLVIFVEPANGRYMSPSSVLCPGLLGLIVKLLFESKNFTGRESS